MNGTQTFHKKLEMEGNLHLTGEMLKGVGHLLNNADEIGKISSISIVLKKMQLSEDDMNRLLQVDDLTGKIGSMIPVHDYTFDVVSAVNILLLQIGCDCGRTV